VPDKSLGGGGLRVSYPSTHTVGVPAPGKDRDLGVVDTHALLLDALRDNDFEKVDEFTLTPKRDRELGPTPTAPGKLQMELDVEGEADAVVLVEQDGCYSWHLPTDAANKTRTRGLPGEKRAVRFDIDIAVSNAAYDTRRVDRALETGPRTRGLFGDWLSGAVRVVVMKFAAPWLVGQAVGFLERHVQPGIVHITDPHPGTWSHLDRLEQVGLPTDRPSRVLLFIHGTFSSTLSAFGSMACSDRGADFLRAALRDYDAVLGFDHPTLSVDPLANATDLLTRVSSVTSGVTFDVITHSRGGLTTRSFAEYVLPGSGWNGRVDKAVFVAATNNGTHLADTDRWYDLIDVATNLTMVGAGVLSGVPGAAPVAAVIGGVVKGLGALVKYLGAYAVEEDGVPGLAAMRPGGTFVTGINESQPGQPVPGTPWFVAKSNFHVTLGDDSHRPPEFPKELAVRLAEGLVDKVFRGDNDLVVDCDSMGSIDAAVGGGFVADTFDFGSNDGVYHGNYFVQPDFVDRLELWLLQHAQAAGAEPPEDSGSEPSHGHTAKPPTRGIEFGGDGRIRELAVDRPDESSAPRPVPAPSAAPSPPTPAPPPGPASPSAGTSAAAHLLASMTAAPPVLVPVPLRVALSRKELQAASGSVSATGSVSVPTDRPLLVNVAATTNARVGLAPDQLGEFATDSFQLPPGGGSSELEFLVEAQAPGPVTVTVVVQDGVTWLKSLAVTSTATAAGDPAGGAARMAAADAAVQPLLVAPGPLASASASVLAGGDQPDFEDYFTIQVQEARIGEDTKFLYVVSCPRLGISERFESLPLRRRADYIAATLADVKRAWDDHGAGAAYLAALQDVGAELFDQLFPEALRALLWANRAKLAPVVLRADEPDVPWELIHLKPAKGRRQQTPAFLGQLGMLRWPFDGYPQATLRARPGRVRALCPDQVGSASPGAGIHQEADFLQQRLGASVLPGTEAALRTLLRGGDFDLLHFSGHGVADPKDSSSAKLVLAQVAGAGGEVKLRYLTARAVEQNARLRREDGSGPLVVLNACQLARGGDQLTGSGGFAKAFLATGAAAYVAALWSIHDTPAHDFVTEFYDRLLAGATVAEAAAAAREKARTAGDATWLSYVIYARPDARLVTQ
jgi:hypothetical protein